MKKVLSISLGSSRRDHKVETEILGEEFLIERRGTDGDKKKAYRLFTELDGDYDAFGIGGIDIYIKSGDRRYTFRDAKKLIKDVRKTPVLDGSGLKDTLERQVINFVHSDLSLNLAKKKVLIVSAVDRFGMAETFFSLGADVVIGDLIFALGIPMRITSLETLDFIARLACPLLTQLPFEWLYPTGNKQDKTNKSSGRFDHFYNEAEIIAGDYHFIRRFLPEKLKGQVIITNTVTPENIEELKERGAGRIVTTTPDLNGRSFGTNVMEGVLVVLSGKRPEELTGNDYLKLLHEINFVPRVIDFK